MNWPFQIQYPPNSSAIMCLPTGSGKYLIDLATLIVLEEIHIVTITMKTRAYQQVHLAQYRSKEEHVNVYVNHL